MTDQKSWNSYCQVVSSFQNYDSVDTNFLSEMTERFPLYNIFYLFEISLA